MFKSSALLTELSHLHAIKIVYNNLLIRINKLY